MLVQRGTKRGVFAVAVAAVAALAVSALPAQAFSPKAENGVTSTTIKLGITAPLTGAAAPGYNKVPYGMKAYFDYVNDNGGVNGRKIQLVIKDDAYSPILAKSVTNDLILKDKVFALVGTLGTANNEATTKFVNDKGVPRLFVNTGFSGFANSKKYPTTYPLFPSYYMEAKTIGGYLDEKYAGKKVALIYQDDDFGIDALAGFAQSGTKFVDKIAYASGSQSDPTVVGKWITRIVASGADTVVVFGVSTATAAALGGAYKAGLAGKIQWILGSVGADPTTIKTLAPTALPLLNGAVAASFLPAPNDSADEYVAQFQKINAQYNKGATFDNNVLVGMNAAMLTVQALRAAGSKLTRAGLMAALEASGSRFASAGFAPLGWSKSSHIGYNGYWFGRLAADATITPVDGAGKYVLYTTDSSSGAVAKTTIARPAMPAKGLPTN
jgi:ABC-type branched-subunit amino acid transport system substrate-binding protein